ncbi:MAG: [citrate (pro-3S)-lyase] ligase [Clostridia bacterium]|nr:[citrate (pro-3S)-lyase] ligase [Clostridia bacterium]
MFNELYAAASVPPLRLQQYNSLLESCGLKNENDADYTALLYEGDKLLACGSLKGGVLKQIAVDKDAEGTGACASIVSNLVTEAYRRGISHLFLYTKPQHERLFASLSFFPIIKTPSVLMMENRKNGLKSFIDGVPKHEGNNGSVVCHCNPMTLGHLHLIRHAAANCDQLYVFVVSEDEAMFPFADRLELVKRCTSEIKNLTVLGSGSYIISRATFPAYFLKENADIPRVWAELDLLLFAQKIAPPLGIRTRFVGEEPFCEVTRAYNERMAELLPQNGIAVDKIERLDQISATKVRELLKAGKVGEIEPLLPGHVYAYCKNRFK